MDDLPKNLLINSLYEEDIKLKIDIVQNICSNFQKKLSIPNDATTAKLRAAQYTGIPAELLSQPVDRISEIPDFKNLKMKIRPMIHEMIQDLYLNKQILPVFKHISNFLTSGKLISADVTNAQLSALQTTNNIPNLLKHLGYKWQRLPGTDRKFILEDQEHANARYNYLKRVTLYRGEKREIVYIDIYNVKEKLGAKTYSGGDPSDKYFITAISSGMGLINKSYCGTRESILKNLESIVTIILLKTPKDSVVIFRDTDQIEEEKRFVPTMSSSRNEMMVWLDSKEIPYSVDMHKSELYYLIQKFIPKTPIRYKWEEVLIASGRPVVIRPTWLEDYGLYHEFWKSVKTGKTEYLPYFPIQDYKTTQKFMHAIAVYLNEISDYQWRTLNFIIKKKETDSLTNDRKIEDIIEKVISMVEVNGLSEEDLSLNELDVVSSSDEL